jgi:hypothetical protein
MFDGWHGLRTWYYVKLVLLLSKKNDFSIHGIGDATLASSLFTASMLLKTKSFFFTASVPLHY